MAFVIKNSEGRYLKSKNAWVATWTDDINDARLYVGSGPARNSINQQGRYNRNKRDDLEVVEVSVKELP